MVDGINLICCNNDSIFNKKFWLNFSVNGKSWKTEYSTAWKLFILQIEDMKGKSGTETVADQCKSWHDHDSENNFLITGLLLRQIIHESSRIEAKFLFHQIWENVKMKTIKLITMATVVNNKNCSDSNENLVAQLFV